MNKTILSVLALTVLLAGCAKQSFVLDGNQSDMARNDKFFSEEPFDTNLDASSKTTHHFFISGLAQGKAINPAKVCGSISKVAKVETQVTFLNGLLGFITFGIYTPHEARVYCK